jgi:hypothetical protein
VNQWVNHNYLLVPESTTAWAHRLREQNFKKHLLRCRNECQTLHSMAQWNTNPLGSEFSGQRHFL